MTLKKFKTIHIDERVAGTIQKNLKEKFEESDNIVNNLKTTVLSGENGPTSISKTISSGTAETLATIPFKPRGNPVEFFFMSGINTQVSIGTTTHFVLYRDDEIVSSVQLTGSRQISHRSLSIMDITPPGKRVSYSFKVVATSGTVTINNVYAGIREL